MSDIQTLLDEIDKLKLEQKNVVARYETIKPVIDGARVLVAEKQRADTRRAVEQEIEAEGQTVVTKKRVFNSQSFRGGSTGLVAALSAFVLAMQADPINTELAISTGAALAGVLWGLWGTWRRGDLS